MLRETKRQQFNKTPPTPLSMLRAIKRQQFKQIPPTPSSMLIETKRPRDRSRILLHATTLKRGGQGESRSTTILIPAYRPGCFVCLSFFVELESWAHFVGVQPDQTSTRQMHHWRYENTLQREDGMGPTDPRGVGVGRCGGEGLGGVAGGRYPCNRKAGWGQRIHSGELGSGVVERVVGVWGLGGVEERAWVEWRVVGGLGGWPATYHPEIQFWQPCKVLGEGRREGSQSDRGDAEKG